MTQRESELRGMGIALNTGAGDMVALPATVVADSIFSGYGQYRPITVRSYSMSEDADLERDQ